MVRDFDWDDANIQHVADDNRLTTDEIEEAFNDPERQRRQAYNQPTPFGIERRQSILGETESGKLLFVVYTIRAGKVRPISAHVASERERREYRRT